MQKSHSKLGLLVVLSCLALVIGLMATPDTASAHQRYHNNRVTPRIVMKLVKGSVHRVNHNYVAREVIYGVGFNDCNNSCTDSCDSCGSSSGNACSSYYYYNVNTCTTTCSNYNACGNSSSSSNTTCSNYNACSSSNSSNTTCSNYNACGSSSSGSSNNSSGSSNTTCSNYNACGSSSTTTTTTTCSNYNACGNSSSNACDCANIQSNTHISSQNVNLSQVPVNAFGEFHITVLVQLVPTVSTTSYRVWAVNRYDGQSSNVLTCPCN